MKPVKELRTLLGMSQIKFSDFTGIPWRTVQNWENGVSTCPEYVKEMLNELIRPYIEDPGITYKRYTWMANVGTEYDQEEKIFLTRESANYFAETYWDHLTDKEKEYHHAYIGMCEIDLDDLTPDTSDGIFNQEYIA